MSGGPAETVAPMDGPAHRLLVADDADVAVPAAAVSAVTKQHVTQIQATPRGRCRIQPGEGIIRRIYSPGSPEWWPRSLPVVAELPPLFPRWQTRRDVQVCLSLNA